MFGVLRFWVRNRSSRLGCRLLWAGRSHGARAGAEGPETSARGGNRLGGWVGFRAWGLRGLMFYTRIQWLRDSTVCLG